MYNVSQIISNGVNNYGKNPAVIVSAEPRVVLTYAEWADRVMRFGTAIKTRLNLSKFSRVAILSLNSRIYFEYFFAIPSGDCVVVPLNIRQSPAELAECLNDCGAEAIFVDETFAAYADKLKAAVKTLKYIIYAEDILPSGKTSFGGTTSVKLPPKDVTHYYEELVASVKSSEIIQSEIRGGNDVYGIFYTGGTTGRSKGVMLTHSNIFVNALAVSKYLNYNETSIYMHVGPMFHLADGASTFAVSMFGGCHAFVPKFTPIDTLKSIQSYKVTNTIMVPTMFAMIVNTPEAKNFDVSSVKAFLYGASPMPEAVLLKAMELFPTANFVQGYGMTETAPLLTILPAECHKKGSKVLTSVGKAVANVQIKIVDENGKELPCGSVGEIVAKGPNVMLGYWGQPKTTASAFKNGWMNTGDGGYMDADGFIFIKDRLKDMIVSGGENVYSAEVENCISKLSGIAESAVIGVPDEKLVEAVCAIVVTTDTPEGKAITPESVEAHCRTLIGGFKVPRKIIVRPPTEPLPKSGAGKILKTVLREPFWKNATRQDIYANKEVKSAYS